MAEPLFAEYAGTPACNRSTRYGAVPVVARNCPVCDSPDSRALKGPGEGIWSLRRCRRCGCVHLGRAPDYHALAKARSWDKAYAAESQRRERLRPFSRPLSRATRWRMRLLPRRNFAALVVRYAAPGNILDIGCGTGTQLAGLPPGYVPFGIEVSVQDAAAADRLFRARGGYVLNRPAVDGLRAFGGAFFSAATLRSYLEHELNPREVLLQLQRTLAPGAVAIVKVPNYASLNRRLTGWKWCGYRFPDHLNYFTPATLRILAESCGYHVRSSLADRLPTSDNMYALLINAGV